MEADNLYLYVATYDDAASATDDFQAIKDAREDGLELLGAVVMERPVDGDVDVKEVGGGEIGGGAAIGAIGGLVVGLFAPPLLLSMGVGAGIGAAIGGLVKRHEDKELGVDMEEYLPPGSSAIVAVVEDAYLDRIDAAVDKSVKKVSKAIDSDDYDKIRKAVEQSADRIADAIDS